MSGVGGSKDTSDFVAVSPKIYRVAANWTLSELDQVIYALERDNLQSEEELFQVLPNKEPESIRQLIRLCSTHEKELFETDLTPEPVSYNESTLDIAKNCCRAIIPAQWSPGPAISSVINEIITTECSDEAANAFKVRRLTGAREALMPNYARIYSYLSDLFTLSKPQTQLEDNDAVAVLDMLFCLLQATDYLLHTNPSDDVLTTLNQVRDRMGLVLSAISSSFHYRRIFLRRLTDSPKFDLETLCASFPTRPQDPATRPQTSLPYIAPLYVINSARMSPDVSRSLRLRSMVNEAFVERYPLPLYQEESLEEVQKNLIQTILNPFGVDVKSVGSVCSFFKTTAVLMRQYEEKIGARVVSSLSKATNKEGIRTYKPIQSASKLLTQTQPYRVQGNLVRPVSLPVDNSEIDKYINVIRPYRRPVAKRKSTTAAQSSLAKSSKKTSAAKPKLYKRVD